MKKGCFQSRRVGIAGSLSDDAPLIETLDRPPAADVSERVSLRYNVIPLSAQEGSQWFIGSPEGLAPLARVL